MKKITFCDNKIYHLYNRGIEKRKVFLDDKDRLRFIHDLFEFNDEAPALNVYYRNLYEVPPHKIVQNKSERKPRKFLIDILAFCLMDNHYHLLVMQKQNNGISEFMKKLGTGYTMYFNQKYERIGPLFQGTFKAVEIENDAHFLHIPYYIHLNPLDFVAPEWRERTIRNFKKAMKFLENYRWSSFLDYIGKKNFPSVTQREFLLKFFKGAQEYKKMTLNWIKELDINAIKNSIIE